MKRHIFCFLLLLPLAMLAQQPFAPVGAKWYINKAHTNLPPTLQPFLVESTGDTTINGISLRQVGTFLLHQDSGRVWYWEEGNLHLIYDFTVTVGDSVSFEFDDYTSNILPGIVVQDTQVVIDGVSVRKWACDLFVIDSVQGPQPVGTYHYAERIGVLYESGWEWQPVVPHGPLATFAYEGWPAFPRCYQDEAISYTYPNYATYNLPCDYTQPVSIEQPATESWRVYPNPSRGQVVVAAPSGTTVRTHEVQVWDAQGRMVLRRPMQGEETALSLTGHVPGLYVLQVRAEGQVLHSQRLVLQ